MTYELILAIDNLFRILKEECTSDHYKNDVVSVDITYTAGGSEINFCRRCDYTSMRNICGEFIE